MATSINFVRLFSRRKSKQQKIDQRRFWWALLVFLITLGVIVAVFLVNLFYQNQLNSTNKEYKKLADQWEYLKQDELVYSSYVNKVKILSSLFSSRQQKQAALRKFRSLFGEGASVVGLKYSEKDEEIVFQIQSDSVFILDEVLNRLSQPDITDEFGPVSRNRLTRDDRGQYVLAVSVNLRTTKTTMEPSI